MSFLWLTTALALAALLAAAIALGSIGIALAGYLLSVGMDALLAFEPSVTTPKPRRVAPSVQHSSGARNSWMLSA